MKKLIVFLLLFTMANAMAASSLSGKISRLYLSSHGLVLFDIEGQCNESNSYDFEFSLSDTYGKEFYSFLLTASATKKEITIGYFGECSEVKTTRISPSQLIINN